MKYFSADTKSPLIKSLSIILPFIIFFYSCTPEPGYEKRTIPSGREIKVAGVSDINLGRGRAFLMLKYYTDLDFSDKVTLKTEVQEVWESFKEEVEKQGMSRGVITVTKMPTFFNSKPKSINFHFGKQKNGKWVLLTKRKRPSNKKDKNNQSKN